MQGYLWIIWVKLAGALWIIRAKIRHLIKRISRNVEKRRWRIALVGCWATLIPVG
jgi:hypothetical protein